MFLTQEIAPKNDSDYKLVGLSKEENEKFWRIEDRFNRIFYRSSSALIIWFSIIISFCLFLVRFERVNIWFYLAMQAFNIAHVACFFLCFYHSIYTMCALHVAVMIVITKKFKRIADRVRRLNAPEAKLINNRRLSRLLLEHNRVHVELQEMNTFFSRFLGVNLIHLFA